jgi:hypothetical protein
MEARRRWPWYVLAVVALALIVDAILIARNWPFTQARMAESLGKATGSRVHFREFDQTFFPSPGCVARKVSVERGSAPPLATAEELKVQGSWAALLTFQRYVSALRVAGLQVKLPGQMPPREPQDDSKKSETTVGEILAHGSVLEMGGDKPKRFDFPKLALRNVGKQEQIDYDIEVKIPAPSGLVRLSGAFGPWRSHETPVSGTFHLMDADLSTVSDLKGFIRAEGKFRGPLARIGVEGATDSPKFQVKRHPVHLKTEFRALVNGSSGDVALEHVDARFLRTVLIASGTIAGEKGKTVAIDFIGDRARIQDLLLLFTSGDKPALNGPVRLRAHAVLPPGEGKFMRKLRFDATFGIEDAKFTKARTQSKVNDLSARSRGEDVGEDEPVPASVVSDLKGAIRMREGIAQLSDVSFSVPGARATGGGQYHVLTKRVDLHGKVHMDATVSEASGGGLKSILLKPFNALFKGKKADAVLPVSVTGYYPRPKFAVSLNAAK